jgi:ABC-type polysaccharide/polyol phosphate transport system ATPase subunit
MSVRLTNVSLDYTTHNDPFQSFNSGRGFASAVWPLAKTRIPPALPALNNISFSLEPGQRLGIIGKNGAGKTTLLKVIAGIHKPTSGHVVVDGRIDALFDINLGFRPDASGRRNIVLRCLLCGWTGAEIDERMHEIISFSGLADHIDRPLRTYSKGMAARLAFSIATAKPPEILVMDEWIGAGDAEFRLQAKQRLTSHFEQARIAIIASHDTSLLKQLSTHILIMSNGSVEGLIPVQDW